MPDELLSVQDSNIQAVANKIKAKAGINTSLAFPSDFVSTLNALDTYPAAQDKVTPVGTVTLTPSSTSYSIPAGTHDGTEKVQIVTEDVTVNPDTQQHEYTPTSGKFFGTFTLNAMSGSSSLFQVEYGTFSTTSSGTASISIPVTFTTMTNGLIMLQGF